MSPASHEIPRPPLGGRDPPCQPRRSRGRQPRHRGELLARRIVRLAVQPGQEILPVVRTPQVGICLMGPTAASTASITPSRSHSSVTAAKPAVAASDTFGAPARTCQPRFGCPLRWAANHLAAIIIPGQRGTYRHLQGRVAGLLADPGSEPQTETTAYYYFRDFGATAEDHLHPGADVGGIYRVAALGLLEVLLLVLVGPLVAKLADGPRPAGLVTLIGYLIALPIVPIAAGLPVMGSSRSGEAAACRR
jgi:hypothetical protein